MNWKTGAVNVGMLGFGYAPLAGEFHDGYKSGIPDNG